jgi:hypothetical protein
MNRSLGLASYFFRSFNRDRLIVVFLTAFPLILVSSAAASAPPGTLPLRIDGSFLNPPPDAEGLLVLLYASTAVVFIASITSYFVAFQLKSVVPRLRIQGYTSTEIVVAFISLTLSIDLFSSLVVSFFSLRWVEVMDFAGYVSGLVIISIIFSTIGLIVAELVNTKTMGLNTLLTLSILDTSFLENPVFSRRYDEWWTDLMPAHRPLKMIFRSAYETGASWTLDLNYVILYEAILITIYILVVALVLGRNR